MKKKRFKKGKIIKEGIIDDYNWRLTPFENPTGVNLFYLTKMYKGQWHGSIKCSKKELRNLKRFMTERKFT